jgi:hypothetical protein
MDPSVATTLPDPGSPASSICNSPLDPYGAGTLPEPMATVSTDGAETILQPVTSGPQYLASRLSLGPATAVSIVESTTVQPFGASSVSLTARDLEPEAMETQGRATLPESTTDTYEPVALDDSTTDTYDPVSLASSTMNTVETYGRATLPESTLDPYVRAALPFSTTNTDVAVTFPASTMNVIYEPASPPAGSLNLRVPPSFPCSPLGRRMAAVLQGSPRAPQRHGSGNTDSDSSQMFSNQVCSDCMCALF